MMFVNNNLLAQRVLSNLNRTSIESTESLRRLASGKRIQSAKDNAAGLAISNSLRADICAKNSVIRGLSDGVNYCHIADGALGTIRDLLTRGMGLAIKAASDNMSDNERKILDEEFGQIKDEIDRIAYSTEAFGRHPLLGSSSTVPLISDVLPGSGKKVHLLSGIRSIAVIPENTQNISVHVHDNGVDDTIQLFTRSGKHLVGSSLSDVVWKNDNGITSSNVDSAVLTQANGFAPGATYDASDLNDPSATYNSTPPYNTSSYKGMTIGYSGCDNPTHNDEYLTINTVTEDLVLLVVGAGAFDADAKWDYMPSQTALDEETELKILAESTYRGEESYIKIPKTPADTESLGMKDTGLDPSEKARGALPVC
jgi:flagellin